MLYTNGLSALLSTPKNNNPGSPHGSLSSSRVSASTHSRSFSIKKVQKYKFSDLSLAYKVRQQLYKILIVFDTNANFSFEEKQIREALLQILQQTPMEINYVVKNVYRYDTNQDNIVTYEQFTNFCLEQHFGQMAIQRLHKIGKYKRGKERLMTCQQFFQTLSYCLNFIDVAPGKDIVIKIFSEIDQKNSGYITYSEYFTFLKEYFGSKSQSAVYVKVDDMKQQMQDQQSKKQIFDYFKKKKEMNEGSVKILQEQDRIIETQRDRREKQDRQRREREQRDKQEWNRKQKQKIQEQRRKIDEQNRKRKQAYQQQQRRRKQKMQEQNRKRRQAEQQKRKRQLRQRELNFQNQRKIDPSQLKAQTRSLCQRVSRLVYHQLKITVLDNDKQYLLYSDKELALQILKNDIKMPQELCLQIINQKFERMSKSSIAYEQLIEACISKYLTQYYPKTLKNFPLNRESFITAVVNGLHFVRAKPIGHILQNIFDIYTTGLSKPQIDAIKFIQIMKTIFVDYSWPRRTGQQKKTKFNQPPKYFPIKTDRL